MEVGSLVVAKRDSGVCCFGQLDGRPGWSVIFRDGGHDGLSPDDAALFLLDLDRSARDVAAYQFRNVGQLRADYERGCFTRAFALCQASDGGRA